MDEGLAQIATTHGSGQSVALNVNESVAKWMLVISAVIMLASLFASIRAMDKASDAQAAASAALAKSEDAKDESARAMRQADLNNWTTMNLEGVMMESGIPIPPRLRPKNLTPNQPKEH